MSRNQTETSCRVGDIVDIKANGAVQKGSVILPNHHRIDRPWGNTLENREGWN